MAKIIDLIDYQKQNALALASVLRQEQEAIKGRNSIAIEKLAKEKLQFLSQLQQTDQRIAKHVDVAQLYDREVLKKKIDEIQSIVRECQNANEVNGEALKRAQLSYNRLYNLMQQSRSRVGMTYNNEGHTNTLPSLGTDLKA